MLVLPITKTNNYDSLIVFELEKIVKDINSHGFYSIDMTLQTKKAAWTLRTHMINMLSRD